MHLNPFNSGFYPRDEYQQNEIQLEVQTVTKPGRQDPTTLFYDGYRFRKDGVRFSKGLQTEQIYWRCATYEHTK